MRKIILLLFILTGLTYSQDPFGSATQTTSIGTATTSSGAVTLNTLAGVITTDNLTGIQFGDVTFTNSKITEASVILLTVFTVEDHVRTEIRSQVAGEVVIRLAVVGDIFASEPKIHFLIIN